MSTWKNSAAPPDAPAKKPFEVALPSVEAPSLKGLSVTVPASQGFTSEDVRARLVELARPFATERLRSPEEGVAWGDEVLLDLVGSSRGHLLPFSVQHDLWMTLEPEPMLPGLYEALVGQKPGGKVTVELTLPANYPAEPLRGAPARFRVHLQAAREVKYPPMDNPEFLRKFGRGPTLEDVNQNIARQMTDELSQELLLQAQRLVLDEVARRTPVTIPSELIDEEIRRRWRESEGKATMALKLTQQEQEEALGGWLKDPATRQEVEQRLHIALALAAIIKRDGLKLAPERVRKLLEDQLQVVGGTMEELTESLRSRPEDQARIEQVATHLMAVEHVMKHARVRFEGA